MVMLLSLIALTVDMPTDVKYPVVGTPLALDCETTDITGTLEYQWYKGDTEQSETGKTLTINGDKSNDGNYKCVVVDTDTKKSSDSPVTNVAFNSKYLII